MSSTDALNCVVGKTINGVIINENRYGESPAVQVFLLFDDNTHYELYGEIMGASGRDHGGHDAVMAYFQSRKGRVTTYLSRSGPPAAEAERRDGAGCMMMTSIERTLKEMFSASWDEQYFDLK